MSKYSRYIANGPNMVKASSVNNLDIHFNQFTKSHKGVCGTETDDQAHDSQSCSLNDILNRTKISGILKSRHKTSNLLN